MVGGYAYDSYGNKSQSSGSFQGAFAYIGAVTDAESGLYYLNARYYDPKTGRFISEDPARDGLNWYAYCGGDPVNNIDQSGYMYSPANAMIYARKWWNGHNPAYQNYGNNDCINYVNQCLYAGGLGNMYGWGRYLGWHSYKTTTSYGLRGYRYYKTTWDISESWNTVSGFQKWIFGAGKNHLVYKIDIASVSILRLNIATQRIRVGDVVLMGEGPGNSVYHATIVGRIAYNNAYFYAHSNNRDAIFGYYGFAEFFKEKLSAHVQVIRVK